MTKVNREDLKIALLNFLEFSGSEKEQNILFEKVDNLSPDPNWSDYIFWSNDYLDKDGNIDIEKLLDKILSYKPIIL